MCELRQMVGQVAGDGGSNSVRAGTMGVASGRRRSRGGRQRAAHGFSRHAQAARAPPPAGWRGSCWTDQREPGTTVGRRTAHHHRRYHHGDPNAALIGQSLGWCRRVWWESTSSARL